MAAPMSKRDLEFLLYEWLDVEALTTRERFAEHSRETFDAVLELSADLAVKRFAPANKAGDQNEPYVGDDGRRSCPPRSAPASTSSARQGCWPAPLTPISAACSCRQWSVAHHRRGSRPPTPP